MVLTTCISDNLKLECPRTMSKISDTEPLYLINTVYMSSLQALYKVFFDNKLNVIILLLTIYV